MHNTLNRISQENTCSVPSGQVWNVQDICESLFKDPEVKLEGKAPELQVMMTMLTSIHTFIDMTKCFTVFTK